MTASPQVIPLKSRAVPGFDPAEAPPAPRPISHKAAVLLVVVPVIAVIIAALFSSQLAMILSIAAALCFVGAFVAGTSNLVRTIARARTLSAKGFAKHLALSVVTSLAGAWATLMSLAMLGGMGRGRQLRALGRAQTAPLGPRSAWVEAREIAVEPELVAADAWRQNGLTEHASVAAFAELSMELIALGAPPELIEDAHADALDELRHTRLCFELARALDGRAIGPEAFPAAGRLRPKLASRELRLAALAVDSLFDGALYEGVSARVVASLTKIELDPRVRPVLTEIARDEARHAAHGFDVLRWCLEAGGAPVARALEVAIGEIRRQGPRALAADAAADGRYERLGLPSRARERAEWETLRDRVILRVERLLAARALSS